MSASPEWMKELDAGEEPEVEQSEDAYDPQADAQAEQAPPEELRLEGEEQVAERVEQQSQTVPLATMLEERKRLQQQLEDERARNARYAKLEDELRMIRAQQANVPRETPQPKAPVPDYLEDPKGYLDSTREELVERLKKLENVTEQTSRQAQMMGLERQVQNNLAAAEATFVKQQPDYYDALQHLRSVRAQQLQVMFPDAKEADILGHMRQEEIALGATWLQQGRNPSQAAYEIAKTLGYRPAEVQNPDKANGQDRPAAASVDRRRLQGMGGGQARGGTPDGELDRLMAGEADEFDQAMAELFPKRR